MCVRVRFCAKCAGAACLGSVFLGVRRRVRVWRAQVVDHYDHPRNVGSFDKADVSVGTGLVGAPACGDVMKLQIKARLLFSVRARQSVRVGAWSREF